MVPEGKFVGKPVVLREWQRNELRKIYDNPAGTRRAILSFGRKNAKTALAAFLTLLHTCGPEAVPNSQLYSSAQSRDQAAILFSLAAKCIRLSPRLSAWVQIRDGTKEFGCRALGTLYKALSAEVATSFGKSPIFLVHDELGQVRGPRSELYEALETAVSAHENPMSIVISTQAPNANDLLSVLIDDALRGEDPRVVVSLYTAPLDDDPFAEETIRKANPAFGDFQNGKEVLAMAEDARRMPSREPEFRNLVLNQRVEVFSPFVSKSLWASCGGPVQIFRPDKDVFIGLDLSAVNDLCAKVAQADVDGKWHVKPTFWLPEDGLREKSRLDRVPYDLWAKQGFLSTTPGKTIEYEYVAKTLMEDCIRWRVRKIAFDSWNFRHLRPWLVKVGFSESQLEGDQAIFESFGQGYKSMSPALRDLEGVLLDGKMAHANHPVLTMCAANAVVARDPAGNRKLDKSKTTGRIDGMVALAMSMSMAMTYAAAPPKEYQMIFV